MASQIDMPLIVNGEVITVRPGAEKAGLKVKDKVVAVNGRAVETQDIPDLLATGYFQAAAFTRSGANHYRIRYEAFDKSVLNKYLSYDAERLRADFLAFFPAGIELSREVWEILQIFNPDNQSDNFS